MRTVAAIEAEVQMTRDKLAVLSKELDAAMISACSHKIGDVVKIKNWTRKRGDHVQELVVRGFNTSYSSVGCVVLQCSPRNKNSVWAKTVRNVWPSSIV